MARLLQITLVATSLAIGGNTAQAQTTTVNCAALAKKYVKTADTLVMNLVGKALNATDSSGMLQQLGLGGQISVEQAVRKDAIAAISPPAQAAVLIYLLHTNR